MRCGASNRKRCARRQPAEAPPSALCTSPRFVGAGSKGLPAHQPNQPSSLRRLRRPTAKGFRKRQCGRGSCSAMVLAFGGWLYVAWFGRGHHSSRGPAAPRADAVPETSEGGRQRIALRRLKPSDQRANGPANQPRPPFHAQRLTVRCPQAVAAGGRPPGNANVNQRKALVSGFARR